MNKTRQFFLAVFFLLAIFFLAVAVWYSPVIFKGYSHQPINRDILLARNYQQSGVLATESDQNVVLASKLVKEQGHSLETSEYWRSLFYAKIFDFIGVPEYNNLILLSVGLYALVLVLFTISILIIFGYWPAIIFALLYIFSPLGWSLAQIIGGYEFCLIFFALFFIFYFWGMKKEKDKKLLSNSFFVIAGAFLALSALSREVTLVFAFIFFLFLLFKKYKRHLFYVFIPFILLIIIFWLPSVLNGQNRYLSLLGSSQATEDTNFSSYLHVFPDPYTYHFERAEYLEQFKNQDLGVSENIETKKALANFGLDKISLTDRLLVSGYVFSQHFSRFFSLEEIGGPLIMLLMVLGLVYLRRKNQYLYQFSLTWLGLSLVIFSLVLLVSRSHLMDFIWLLILLFTLGLIYLMEIIKEFFKLSERKFIILQILVLVLVLYHLLLVNHIILGRAYDDESVLRSLAYSQEINKFDIADNEVIAIAGDFSSQAETLNYLTDKSFVIFRGETLKKLLASDKLEQAFATFKVKYILGYSDDLSQKIVKQTKITNLAANSLVIEMPTVSENKSFLMNIIR